MKFHWIEFFPPLLCCTFSLIHVSFCFFYYFCLHFMYKCFACQNCFEPDSLMMSTLSCQISWLFFVKTNGGFVFSYFSVCLGGGLSFRVVLICQFNVILRFLLKIMSVSGHFVLCLKLSVKNTRRAVFLFIQLNEITYDPDWQFLPFYKTCLFKICFLIPVH